MPSRPRFAASLQAQPLDALVASCIDKSQELFARSDQPVVVVSPYRFNPLGAHIDHQGGAVLARCLDQYTVLCFWQRTDALCSIQSKLLDDKWTQSTFAADELDDQYGWDAMARASVAAFAQQHEITSGFDAVVFGTLVSGGLSSSASVILAYLNALCEVNSVNLTQREYVDLVRRVENDYRGLNNGIQDQMSIVYAQKNHMALLDVQSASAQTITDPDAMDDCGFLMFYSGVSRNLVTGSNFNQRVAECQQAAKLLWPAATHLGEVPEQYRTDACVAQLPEVLQRRTRHVYGEMQRVKQGCAAWQAGNLSLFGDYMNASCQSSIHLYESGSPWLIDLHNMASTIEGVYGNRFSGGGYGGCLFMLVDLSKAEGIANELRAKYVSQYPELDEFVRVNLALSESSTRMNTP